MFEDRLLRALAHIGARVGESEESRLRKTYLLASTLMAAAAGVVWGAIYWAFDEPLAAAIPWSYVALSLVTLAVFARSGSFNLLRRTHLLLILALPVALQVALGGFVSSSAVVVWSFLAPLGALVFSGVSSASRWLAADLALLVLAGLVAADLRPTNNLPRWLADAFFVLNIGTLSLITFTVLASFLRQKDVAMELLDRERRRSESLLLNVLPAQIAERLKAGETVIADAHAAATVLFADAVGFTPLSAALEPKVMVGLLNEVFSRFDDLALTHGLEKIRTIGDNYMAVAGVPRARRDHAQAAARMALDMLEVVRRLPDDRRLEFRIGLNSGPLVAGVIGKRKFVFDLWGDPVNTASRMESHGVPGRIQITEATYELLKEDFRCEPRGAIEVKGKGTLSTWFLVAPRGEPPLGDGESVRYRAETTVTDS